MRTLAFSVALVASEDQTSITNHLNSAIAASGDGALYSGGKGILVRSLLDGYQEDPEKVVVPASFWVNDIMVPSQIYPDVDPGEDITRVAHRASVGVVASDLVFFFVDADNIQSPEWASGVFYAGDANSCDARCQWDEDFGVYTCPSTTGAGCHYDFRSKSVDQITGDLAQDKTCQCNYGFHDDWSRWVEAWHTTAPNSTIDQAICWTNNVRDLVGLQNALFTAAAWQYPGTVPTSYWGWNEVPVNRLAIGDSQRWDAVMIHLPVEICGSGGSFDSVVCLADDAQERLESTLQMYVDRGYLVPGFNNIAFRPGSSVVFAREWRIDDGTTMGKWNRWFFCENWFSPGGMFTINSFPMADGNDGACYIDWGSLISV